MSITKELLEKHIGKHCIIEESAIAGLQGKKVLIEEVLGNKKEGFRFKVNIGKPLYSWSDKTDYYPPWFLCKILETYG